MARYISEEKLIVSLMDYSKGKKTIGQCVTDTPTEDVAPIVRGKWYDKKTTIKGAHGLAYGRWGCSVCKRKFPQKSNYCPNCGADMRGEE